MKTAYCRFGKTFQKEITVTNDDLVASYNNSTIPRLAIEARIGELAEKEEQAKAMRGPRGTFTGPSGRPPKYERLGLPEKRMKQEEAIHRNPEIVERVKAQARENEEV